MHLIRREWPFCTKKDLDCLRICLDKLLWKHSDFVPTLVCTTNSDTLYKHSDFIGNGSTLYDTFTLCSPISGVLEHGEKMMIACKFIAWSWVQITPLLFIFFLFLFFLFFFSLPFFLFAPSLVLFDCSYLTRNKYHLQFNFVISCNIYAYGELCIFWNIYAYGEPCIFWNIYAYGEPCTFWK